MYKFTDESYVRLVEALRKSNARALYHCEMIGECSVWASTGYDVGRDYDKFPLQDCFNCKALGIQGHN